jgi:2-keto-4-pentenoate hydratase/2-oxohepta-3-ene-1,7-dioic acid hydratase in catechol pathway
MEALVSSKRGTVLYAARQALDRKEEIRECVVPRAKLLAPILPPSLPRERQASLVAPGESIPHLGSNGDVDFDAELGIVAGREGRGLKVAEARQAIFGYTLMVTVSTGDEFAAALGPCIVTPDEFDARHAEVASRVNGRLWSKSSPADAKVNIPRIVAEASKQGIAPGDVFGTGTMGHRQQRIRPPKPGSTVEVESDDIGVLKVRLGKKARRKLAS